MWRVLILQKKKNYNLGIFRISGGFPNYIVYAMKKGKCKELTCVRCSVVAVILPLGRQRQEDCEVRASYVTQ